MHVEALAPELPPAGMFGFECAMPPEVVEAPALPAPPDEVEVPDVLDVPGSPLEPDGAMRPPHPKNKTR